MPDSFIATYLTISAFASVIKEINRGWKKSVWKRGLCVAETTASDYRRGANAVLPQEQASVTTVMDYREGLLLKMTSNYSSCPIKLVLSYPSSEKSIPDLGEKARAFCVNK